MLFLLVFIQIFIHGKMFILGRMRKQNERKLENKEKAMRTKTVSLLSQSLKFQIVTFFLIKNFLQN
ncbi:protein of unknown function [Xenorhabdus bovienii]|uniref:Uncharacterized protein n=1 Tax=Xenorhabdus bovienii TaxID=40576 RepID=A0A0B6X2A9_XENBV|nr:protein of unknown function [Xenorhabdus bovienii]